ncbi:MAG: cullin, a subunit of ubiquitin ligase, partial [Mycobacterium sp.]|nr:cullin, a subunit of ubiquitin ligase [Mycobacterium sp.]
HGIAHRLDRGWWRRVLPATYVVASADEGELSRRWAALLWAPPGSCLSHDTAAVLQRLPLLRPPDRRIHVRTEFRRDCPEGLVLHRPRRGLAATDLEARGELPVTGVARTALDVARTLPERRRAGFLIACVQQRLVRPPDLVASAARGGKADASLRCLLASLDPAAQSDSERAARGLLVAAGLPVEAQVEVHLVPIGVIHLDLAIRITRVAIEVDGLRYHEVADAVARDRQRDELLRRAGWDVVRVMPHELSRPEDFVSRVWQAHALRLAALQVARPA